MEREDQGSAGVSSELRQMWFQLAHGEWSSLVVIPTDPGTSVAEVMVAAVETSRYFELREFRAIDATGIAFGDGPRLAGDLAQLKTEGRRVVVAVDSPLQNAGAIPVIMAAQAALLLVTLGSSTFDAVNTIVEIVGRERVLGCVAMPPAAAARKPQFKPGAPAQSS